MSGIEQLPSGCFRVRWYKNGTRHGKTFATRELAAEFTGEIDVDHTAPLPTRNIEFPDKKKGSLDWREVLDVAEAGVRIRKKSSWSQNEATVIIKTDRPIAVTYSADWHLGASSVDYRAFRAHVATLLETPGLYLASCGDLYENTRAFSDISAILSQVIPADLQAKTIGAIFDEIVDADKFLGAWWGNHDVERDQKLFGESPIAERFGKRIPFFPGIGLMRLQVGATEYSILGTHKPRYHSFLRPTHGNMRLAQINFPGDVVVTAHTHNPAMEWLYQYGEPRVWVKCGTFKTDDGYSNRYFQPGVIGTPTIVFFPGSKKNGAVRHAGRCSRVHGGDIMSKDESIDLASFRAAMVATLEAFGLPADDSHVAACAAGFVAYDAKEAARHIDDVLKINRDLDDICGAFGVKRDAVTTIGKLLPHTQAAEVAAAIREG